MGELHFDLLVAGYEDLHDAPSDQVADTADAEHYEISGRLAFVAHKRHIGLSSVVKENT